MNNVSEKFNTEVQHFYQHPSLEKYKYIMDLFAELSFQEKSAIGERLLIWSAMAISKNNFPLHNSMGCILVNRFINKKSKLAKNFYSDKVVTPRKFDQYWIAFFATGEDFFLEELFRFIDLTFKESPEVGSLFWSFSTLSNDHSQVKHFLEQKLECKNLSSRQEEFIQEMRRQEVI